MFGFVPESVSKGFTFCYSHISSPMTEPDGQDGLLLTFRSEPPHLATDISEAIAVVHAAAAEHSEKYMVSESAMVTKRI